MKGVFTLLLLIYMCGCLSAEVIDIPSEGLPPATGEPDIPITASFEECAKYYPVMESWPMQCRDPVADKTFTQEIGKAGNVGEGCVQHSDCSTPMEYLVQSNCPFGSACIDSRCAVVCPLTFHDPIAEISRSYPYTCNRDLDCDCSNRAHSIDCVCLDGSCVSVEAYADELATEEFVIIEHSGSQEKSGYYVRGKAKYTGVKPLASAAITANFYDASGSFLNSGSDFTDGFNPVDIWEFEIVAAETPSSYEIVDIHGTTITHG